MTVVVVLVSQNHWDYYSDEEVSHTLHDGAFDETTYSECGNLPYPHNRIASRPGTRRDYSVNRSLIWGHSHAYDRQYVSEHPETGSNPTMIDLINWGD